jgi:CheY-like chemotaxis protein
MGQMANALAAEQQIVGGKGLRRQARVPKEDAFLGSGHTPADPGGSMSDTYITSRLQGRKVLIVEDDYLQAQHMAELMQSQGAEVVGLAPSVEEGMGLLLRGPLPDMAILDVRLGQETVFPLVEALRTIGIPFVFASASPDWSLPEAYEGVPHCEKPLDERELLRALAMLSQVR